MAECKTGDSTQEKRVLQARANRLESELAECREELDACIGYRDRLERKVADLEGRARDQGEWIEKLEQETGDQKDSKRLDFLQALTTRVPELVPSEAGRAPDTMPRDQWRIYPFFAEGADRRLSNLREAIDVAMGDDSFPNWRSRYLQGNSEAREAKNEEPIPDPGLRAETDAAALEEAQRSRGAWEQDALMYCRNADHWRKKYEATQRWSQFGKVADSLTAWSRVEVAGKGHAATLTLGILPDSGTTVSEFVEALERALWG